MSEKSEASRGSLQTGSRRSGARTALAAGFGGLLVLMAMICVDSLRSLEAFASNSARIHQDFLYREQTLDQVRAGLYDSGDVMREYVQAESDAATQHGLQSQFETIRSQTNSALNACVQTLPPGQVEPFMNLERELDRYWTAVEPIFALSDEEKTEKGGALLRNDVLAQHLRIVALAKDVSALNNDDLKEAEQQTAGISRQYRRRLLIAGTIVFGLGLILAGATTVHVGGLEKRVEEKYEQSVAARSELRELSRRLVDTEERERRAISRELHDEVGQSLSALLVDVENLTATHEERGDVRQGLEHIKTLAEKSVNEVRNMALLLRPSMLDDLGLVAAVEWQAREVSKRTGIIVDTVDENVPEDLPEEYRICVYRIVQESLNNCAKHAGATHARVVLRRVPNRLEVRVEDDGKGFDAVRVRGLGLLGMNERVSQLGGTLRVDSGAGRGTRLAVDLPLPGGISRGGPHT